jgi:hypothetical protein
MAKATALSPDLMAVSETIPAIDGRLHTPAKTATADAQPAKQAPLQIRIPAHEVKAIKRAALEADQTISDFMLACFHAYMKKTEHA